MTGTASTNSCHHLAVTFHTFRAPSDQVMTPLCNLVTFPSPPSDQVTGISGFFRDGWNDDTFTNSCYHLVTWSLSRVRSDRQVTRWTS